MAFATLPVLGAVLGAAIAVIRTPTEQARSHIQHFAAGVVFSLVAVELLPDIMKRHEPIQVIVGFTIGVAARLAVRAWSEALSKAESSQGKVSFGLLAGVGIDISVDGLLLG